MVSIHTPVSDLWQQPWCYSHFENGSSAYPPEGFDQTFFPTRVAMWVLHCIGCVYTQSPCDLPF